MSANYSVEDVYECEHKDTYECDVKRIKTCTSALDQIFREIVKNTSFRA